jgi:hypothetical protein
MLVAPTSQIPPPIVQGFRAIDPLKDERFAQDKILSHTSLLKGQSLHKWTIVSKVELQIQQEGLKGHPLFWRFSAVNTLLCKRGQAKKRHFDSVFAFQMEQIFIVQKIVENWMLYALLALYCPSAVHLQEMVSSKLLSSCMLLIACQRVTKSFISSSRMHGRYNWIQLLVLRAWKTEMFFFLAFLNRFGAIILGVWP